jgi:DhnA family fructose-bisphosphate aldolase class Ia
MTNPKRGELKIVLADKKFDARVTLDVIMRIERSLGKGIVKIAQSMSEADVSVTDIVAILTPVIRAGGNDVSEKDVGEAIWDAGLAQGIAVCGEVLGQALGAGGDEGNEEEAGALL